MLYLEICCFDHYSSNFTRTVQPHATASVLLRRAQYSYVIVVPGTKKDGQFQNSDSFNNLHHKACIQIIENDDYHNHHQLSPSR